jgi:hypothetical protein
VASWYVPAWYREPFLVEGTADLTDPGRLLLSVAVPTLVSVFDPLHADPWRVGPIAPDQVGAALRDGRLRSENPGWQRVPDAAAESDMHAERIAWLIRHGWDISAEALEVDVDEHGGALLIDGNHRLYALAFLGVTGPVVIELSGFLDEAEILLGVTIPAPAVSACCDLD